jgi:hypothetical protein
MDVKIEFTPPDRKKLGFLKRQKQALTFKRLFKNPDELTAENIDELAEYLSQFVTVPETHDEKIAALLEASQEQFEDMVAALVSTSQQVDKEAAEANPTPTPTS